jgi:HNH endonuclease
MKDRELTQARLRELLHYDRKTGVFTNRVQRGSRALPGTRAGSVQKKGYIEIGVDGRSYYAHRLAWLYVRGVLPENVDHKNHVRSDNRWKNLRSATALTNAHNLSKRAKNTSGHTGAFRCRSKWRAQIKVNGVVQHLGVFDSPYAAHRAYKKAAQQRATMFN